MPTDTEILTAYNRIARTQAEPEAVNTALKEAKDKLAWIIGRYGDGNGRRLKAGYIAQLVDEAVLAGALEKSSFECWEKVQEAFRQDDAEHANKRGTSYTMPMFIKDLAKAKADIKKGRPTQETTDQEITHCYYTALASACQ